MQIPVAPLRRRPNRKLDASGRVAAPRKLEADRQIDPAQLAIANERSALADLEAVGDLAAEVVGLVRVHTGELAEPQLWERPSHRAEVALTLGHLAPIQSLRSLLESWRREAQPTSAVRVAYAIAWVRLFQRRPSDAARAGAR